MRLEAMENQSWIIITDLDGTLLDEETYSFDAALPALDFLKKQNIPVVPCTSKTAAEVQLLMKKIGLHGPFIVENGSALFYPAEYFKHTEDERSAADGNLMVVFGKDYQQILSYFQELKETFGLPARGFSEMDIREIALHTGLSEEEAYDAGNRRFSEPFILLDKSYDMEPVFRGLNRNEFRLLRGNRFYHLLGHSDKGNAVRYLREAYRQADPTRRFRTIGIGDSKNDLELLQAVDYPVLVRRANGRHLEGVTLDGLLLTNGIGPEGWQEAVMHFFRENNEQET